MFQIASWHSLFLVPSVGKLTGWLDVLVYVLVGMGLQCSNGMGLGVKKPLFGRSQVLGVFEWAENTFGCGHASCQEMSWKHQTRP